MVRRDPSLSACWSPHFLQTTLLRSQARRQTSHDQVSLYSLHRFSSSGLLISVSDCDLMQQYGGEEQHSMAKNDVRDFGVCRCLQGAGKRSESLDCLPRL